jgi:NAD(P)H-hydrate epimerase
MSEPADSVPLPRLKPRTPDGHKGTYGRVLVIGGSLGMSGAISLTGKAALRSGAGLVQLAVPAPCLPMVAGFEPSYMTAPLPADEQGRIDASARERLLELADTATVVAVGPGLGRSSAIDQIVAWLYKDLNKPLVVDADGLNALADQPDVLPQHQGERVLTPHPGEFARLINRSTRDVQAEREGLASEFAARHGVVLVLKGHRTFITDGKRGVQNTTGNPGMATGGSGDVLTGIIAGLAAQGLSAFDAAHLAVHVHGLAGDLAVRELSEVSLIASDLLDWLPTAFKALEA